MICPHLSLEAPACEQALLGLTEITETITNTYEYCSSEGTDDIDGDGVPDRVDLAPDQWVDAKGAHSGHLLDIKAFDGDNPFVLEVYDLQSGWPVMVDLQMRPVNPDHLGYSMNVLDWPAGDVDGQIQHKASTTFADSNNEDVRNPDDIGGRVCPARTQ